MQFVTYCIVCILPSLRQLHAFFESFVTIFFDSEVERPLALKFFSSLLIEFLLDECLFHEQQHRVLLGEKCLRLTILVKRMNFLTTLVLVFP